MDHPLAAAFWANCRAWPWHTAAKAVRSCQVSMPLAKMMVSTRKVVSMGNDQDARGAARHNRSSFREVPDKIDNDDRLVALG